MRVVKFGTYIDNDVVINDKTVSRNHAQITKHDDGHFSILDLQSINGTFVNGERIDGEVELHPGDSIVIGKTTLLWEDYFLSEEERELRERLEALRREVIEREHIESAMCYCRQPDDWEPRGGDEKEGPWQKVLSIVTVVIISTVVLGFIVAFILL